MPETGGQSHCAEFKDNMGLMQRMSSCLRLFGLALPFLFVGELWVDMEIKNATQKKTRPLAGREVRKTQKNIAKLRLAIAKTFPLRLSPRQTQMLSWPSMGGTRHFRDTKSFVA